MSFDHERAALVAAVGHLFETRVMPYSGHANVSLRINGELVTAIEEAAEAEVRASPLGGARDFPASAWDAARASMSRLEKN